MTKCISQLNTFIRERILHIQLYVDDELTDPFVTVSFSELTAGVPNLSAFDLDYFIGCNITETKVGNPPSVEYKFSVDSGWANHQKKHPSLKKSFTQIAEVETRRKRDGNPYVQFITGDNQRHSQNFSLFQSEVGLSPEEFPLLIGTFVCPVYFKKGDTSTLFGRHTPVTQDDKLLKSLNIRIEGTIDEHYHRFGKPIREQIAKQTHHSSLTNPEENRTYTRYNGYNGFDDQTIDDAFNGDPEATWNVD